MYRRCTTYFVVQRPKLQPVTTRLFAADVTEVKRRAGAQGIPWQTYLRIMINRALKRREVIT